MKINLDYYKGTDLYTDGDIEKDIIQYLQNGEDIETICNDDTRYPVIYHLTSIRSNILNWYPFKENCSILEIGAGMGAITPTLCDKARRVVSVELSRQRASAIEIRCKNRDNLELIVGNLNDVQFQEKFDYITLIGVLEYAPLYTNSSNPFLDFLSKIRELLKPDGKILIAIENKFGMKYFSGVPEDHTGIRYDNIIGYKDKKGAQTFGREEITKLLNDANLKYKKFYYPLPDYKLPNVIFTDNYLPDNNNITRDLQYYNPENILNFDELDAYRELIKEDAKLFPYFSNSFLIEAGTENFVNDVNAVFFNNWRKVEYRLRTILKQDLAIKSPITEKSISHMNEMGIILEKLRKNNLNTIDQYQYNSVISQYIKQPNYENNLLQIYKKNGVEALINEIRRFYQNLINTMKPASNTDITVFDEYEITCPDYIKEKLNFIEDGIYDLRFENCFLINDKYYFFDQEWIENNVPIEFIFYRSLINFNKISIDDRNQILATFNLNDYIPLFDTLEKKLVSRIKNEKFSQIFAKPYMIEDVLQDRIRLLEENEQLKLQSSTVSTPSQLENTMQLSKIMEILKSEMEQKKNIQETMKQLEKRIEEQNALQDIKTILEQKIIERNNLKETITNLQQQIEEKNAAIDNLNLERYQIVNSRSFRLANTIKKTSSIPRKLARSGKEKIHHLTNQFGITTYKNDYRNIKTYDSYYQENRNFSDRKTDIKALVFYLPQFHTFKENDEWWGKGFTEWTNAKKAKPRYPTHYQPRLPHDDIGYYDLTDASILKKQADLAKEHGIYGFCFYLYWFSGKRLMEKPLDLLLEHPEIDMNFCLCWANENWTRKWDGQNQNILIAQEYSTEDPIKFIHDIKKYIDDKRYIKINGKPVIMIYNPTIIPDVEEIIQKWRDEAKKIGIGEIVVWTRNLLVDNIPPVENADAEFDFPPLQKGFANSVISGVKNGYLFNYRVVVEEMKKLYQTYHHSKRLYLGTTMGWDNSSRRKDGFTVFHGYSLESFYDWNQAVIQKTREMHPEDERFIFINAWNEWCEGTYLEPDQKYGYANINTLSKALFDIPFEELKVTNNRNTTPLQWNKKIAVQIHLFYPDLCDEIITQLNYIPYEFDCYITTSDEEKKKIIEKEFSEKCYANKTIIEVTPNRGRDVAPFLVQMSKVIDEYDYICHIHSKKSKTVDYGNRWRRYLYHNLFGSRENLIQIFNEFETHEKLGIIYPEIYPIITDQINYYGNNLSNCKQQFKKLGIPKNYINEKLIFPAGTMFWAKKDAIEPLFKAKYQYSDFMKENNQIDATPAHAIERIICNLAFSRGYSYQKIFNNSKIENLQSKCRKILYCFDNKENLDNYQIEYLDALGRISNNIVFITNRILSPAEISKLQSRNIRIFNTTLNTSFKMWKDYLLHNEISDEIDEIIITNSNQEYSGLSFNKMLNQMNNEVFLSLGYTIDMDRNKENIFITDFMVFSRELVIDPEFRSFLSKIETDNVGYELKRFLQDTHKRFDIYLKETKYINDYIVNIPIDQREPYLMLILGSPIINHSALYNIDMNQKQKISNFIQQAKRG